MRVTRSNREILKGEARMTNLLEVVVTARPSWARVKSIVLEYAKLNSPDSVRICLVGPSVSERYGDLRDQIPNGIEVKAFPSLGESDSLESVALNCLAGATALARHWGSSRPDCVLVIADRTETLGVASTAALMQIPLIHLQGGEVSGSIDDKIRDSNSKLADLHLTTNEFTATRLLSMGESAHQIHVVGCPSVDLVRVELEQPEVDLDIKEIGGVGSNFDLSNPFGIIMFHPDTLNEHENLILTRILLDVVQNSSINWFWFWPNPDHGTHLISKEIRKAREHDGLKNVRFVVNLPPEIFIRLAIRSNLLVGNSSFGIRESSFIGLPVINIGKRQLGRQKSENVIDIPVVESYEMLAEATYRFEKEKLRFDKSLLYGDGMTGLRASRVISAWTPITKLGS